MTDAEPNRSAACHPEVAHGGRPSIVRLIGRALRLRCPACGGAPIFCGWFAMHEACAACGRQFQRGAGYFLGSIYFNYGVTGMLVVVMYFGMYFQDVLTNDGRLGVLVVFAVVFPLWFFRNARALWIALDEWLDPWPNEEEQRGLARRDLAI